MKRLSALLLVFIAILLYLSCGRRHVADTDSTARTMQQLKDSGELVVLTLYGSTSYFKYRGQEMGYQYELSEQFAQSLGLKLRVKVAHDVPDLIEKLLAGEGDMIAYNVPLRKDLKDDLAYCGEEMITHQVIVQRGAPAGEVLTDVTQLVGKDIYVKPGKHLERLRNLNEELGGGINIHEEASDSVTIEDLITQVAQGTIAYTVADNDIAQINKTYYPSLNVKLSISFDQKGYWAVRANCPELAEAADKWHRENVTSQAHTASIRRYFEMSKHVEHPAILSLKEGKISIYDNLFKKYAKEIGWDWRLLASLAYTESNFDTTAVSWAGAKGLMQLMPRTSRAMGVPAGREADAEESVKAAVKYIADMDRGLRMVPDKQERIHFILAAYNAGVGHIYDAIALAKKYNKNSSRWYGNVEEFVLLKSHEQYYADPVCRNGYFRGIETCNFVRDIMTRYDVYKQKIPEK
jgi:membrane-bound lytic murein transglycosylase F